MGNNKTEKTARKQISPLNAWAIAFGCIIGWGAFVMPGTTFLPVAGPLGTIIAIAVGTVLMLIIGRNYSFLMEKRPGSGGPYTYTKEAFGRDHAFLCSWFLSLSYLTVVFLNATALFVVARTMFGRLFQFGFHYQIAGYDIYLGEILISVLSLVVIGMLFILTKAVLRWVQTILALVMVAGVVVLGAAVFANFKPDSLAPLFSGEGAGSATIGIFTIVLLAPWAFVGFDTASLETERFNFSVKKSRGIVAISILCGGFVYSMMTIVGASARPDGFASWQDYVGHLDDLSGTVAVPTVFAAENMLGNPGLILVGVVALAAIITGIIAAYRATANMLSTMALDKILTKSFARTTFCIVFIMLISIVFSFFGRNALEWFVEMTSFGAIVGFGYTSAAAWKLAAKENNRCVWITGFLGTGISVIFGIAHLVSKIADVETMGAEAFLLLAVWCLLGFVFYWRTMHKSELSDFRGVAVTTTVLFCLLMYSIIMWFVKSVLSEIGSPELRGFIAVRAVVLMLFTLTGTFVMRYIQGALRRRHNKLEREKIHAEESNKAKSRFLFSMTHDIRTPMNAILGYTQLVKQAKNLPENIIEYTDKIDESGRHLMALLNDILEMSRIESGTLELHPKPDSIYRAIKESCDILELQMREKNINFIFDADRLGEEWAVFDRERFMRVILNLLSNALKFTPDGGTVKATAASSRKGRHADYVISVKDNGIGMSKEFAENVFEAFTREQTSTVSQIQGTGLGMSISKSIIDSMGGTIRVVTAPEKGTEFIIRLKLELCEPVSEKDEIEAAPSSDFDFSGKTILLVDDMEINRKMESLLLENLGLTVETAENGQVALDKLNEREYDAVLMDIQMPVMNGYEATEKIRLSQNPRVAGVPVVAVTANAFSEDIRKAEQAGVNGYVSKPIDRQKLRDVLIETLK